MPDKRDRKNMSAPQPTLSAHEQRLEAQAKTDEFFNRMFGTPTLRRTVSSSLTDPEADKYSVLAVASMGVNLSDRIAAVTHPKLTWKDVRRFLKPDAKPEVIAAIIGRSDCPDRARKKFADHDSSIVRAAVGRWCANEAVLVKLAFDSEDDVSNAVAANEAAPKKARAVAAVRW